MCVQTGLGVFVGTCCICWVFTVFVFSVSLRKLGQRLKQLTSDQTI